MNSDLFPLFFMFVKNLTEKENIEFTEEYITNSLLVYTKLKNDLPFLSFPHNIQILDKRIQLCWYNKIKDRMLVVVPSLHYHEAYITQYDFKQSPTPKSACPLHSSNQFLEMYRELYK